MDRTQRKRSTSRGRAARAVARVACAALVAVALWPAPAPAGEADASPVPAARAQAAPIVPIAAEAARAPEPAAPAVPEAPGPEAGAPDPEAGSGAPDPGPDSGPGMPGPDAGRPDAPGPGASDAVQEDAAQRSEADGPLVGAPAPQPNGPLGADPRANGDPQGFSWKWVPDPDNQNGVRINGYDYNGDDKGKVATGTVHVPATALDNGVQKPVTSIAGGNGKYNNLQCDIDFTGAINLEKMLSSTFQMGNATSGYGPKGTIDLSKTKLAEIPTSAFYNSTKITSLVLPSNLKTIGDNAFYLCGLTGTLSLPATLETIGSKAFYGGKSRQGCQLDGLSGLQNTKLTRIGSEAFANNEISGDLVFPATLTSVGGWAFSAPDPSFGGLPDDIVKGNLIASVKFLSTSEISLGNNAFQYNSISRNPFVGTPAPKFKLGEFVFANNKLTGTIDLSNDKVTNPSPGIIAYNPDVQGVVVSSDWQSIPNFAFKGLKSLATVTISDNPQLRRIGQGAFQGCTSLQEVDFKNVPLQDDSAAGKPAVGAQAFQGCTSLTAVHVGTGAFGSVANVDLTLDKAAFKDTALSFIDIPPAVSGVTKISVTIGDKAFMNSNLGAFPNPLTGGPLGYLPLDRRNIKSIGESAFENAQLEDVRLPRTLTRVGTRAFAANHMTHLELPNNAALDGAGAVGVDVLKGQTVKDPAIWGENDKSMSKADVQLDPLHSIGAVHDRVSSVTLNAPNPAGGVEKVQPDNATWKTDRVATFDKSKVEAAGATFTYGYEVYRAGGSSLLSTGDVTLSPMKKGVPYEFLYYDDPALSGRYDYFIQWVPVDGYPAEDLHGTPNYGLAKPGYHTDNAKWKHQGSFVDPSSVKAVDGNAPSFSNYWIANSYSVSFDDGWDAMVANDTRLGMPDPADPDKTVRNTAYVSGTMDPVGSLSYGAPADLPGNAFKMGGYEFDGWATSPDLAANDRKQGSNYFAAGTPISTPEPAPAAGGALTLYAQWKAVDYGADDPALLGFLSIPSSLSLEPYGDRVWSEPSDPAAPAGDHSVVVAAAPELPGATWPAGKAYRVSVTRPSAGAPLLSLSLPGGGGARAFDVLDASGAVYDPGSGPAPAPLMVIDPRDPAAGSGSFSLRSVDPVGSFLANARYSGTMEFRVDIVSATTREVAL